MKKLMLLMAGLFWGCLVFGQDLLGLPSTEIQKTTKGVKGIQVQVFGDSTVEVINKFSDRYFKFKLDAATGICYREDVWLSSEDLVNLHILDKFLKLKRKKGLEAEKIDTFYQTNLKTIEITHEENKIHIAFKLKISPSAFMAIRNGETNN